MSRIEKALEKATRIRESEKENEKDTLIPLTENNLVERTPFSPSPYLVTLNSPHSPVAEEYRKLKSRVVRITKGKNFMNTILVTSSIGSEGKTITALNLAITLAQEYDHSVLLVETDLRKPDIHRYLNKKMDKGLVDCLLNGVDINEVLITTEIDRLAILPAGKTPSNPVELLMSEKMESLVKQLKHHQSNRYVIFDSPPLLPFAETSHLASLVDGVILVVKEEFTPLSSLEEALQLLKEANVMGVVYNGAKVDRFNDNYYYLYERYRAKEKKD